MTSGMELEYPPRTLTSSTSTSASGAVPCKSDFADDIITAPGQRPRSSDAATLEESPLDRDGDHTSKHHDSSCNASFDLLAHQRPQALPPTDQGYAWAFLAAAFMIEAMSWGFAFSVGVLHEYWTSQLFPDPKNAKLLSVTSTLVTGVLFTAGILVRPLFAAYSHYRARIQYAGLLLSVAGIVAAAFANSVPVLLVTAGIMYPLGAAVVYYPVGMLIYEWFHKRVGLAAGIMYSGSGLGGALWPIPIQALLSNFSYRTAMIALALFYGLTCCIALVFIRERVPVGRKSHSRPMKRQRVSLAFFRIASFYWFTAAILFWGLGNVIPSVYLPTFAKTLGLSSGKGTLLVALVNGASALGLPIIGFLCDRFPIRIISAGVGMGAALSAFLLWGFGLCLPVLICFALLFGFFALGSVALWSGFISVVAKDHPETAPTLFTIFAFATGVGNVVSGVLSDILLGKSPLSHLKSAYHVGSYGSLILWTGSVMAAGSIFAASYRT